MQNDWFIYYLIALATFAIGIAIYNITTICIKHVLSELQEKPEFKRRPKPDPEGTTKPIINPIKPKTPNQAATQNKRIKQTA